jgi:hypothetical protein
LSFGFVDGCVVVDPYKRDGYLCGKCDAHLRAKIFEALVPVTPVEA